MNSSRDWTNGRRCLRTAVLIFVFMSLVVFLGGLSTPAAAQTGAASLTITKVTNPADATAASDFTLFGQVLEWGSSGSDPGQFNQPVDVALDAVGNIYVADYGNHRIQKFNSSGAYQGSWGSFGSEPDQFYHVYGVAADAQGYVYVSDYYQGRVKKFTSAGAFQGSLGSFFFPGDLVVDTLGNIYVTEFYRNQIQKYDALTGTWLVWSGSGGGPVEFDGLGGIALDAQDMLYIADQGNKRILKIDGNGTPQAQVDLSFTPGAVSVNSVGSNFYVVEAGAQRIHKIDAGGNLLNLLGDGGSGPGQLSSPHGIALDANDQLVVADQGNNRIQRFVDDATTLQHGQLAAFDAIESGTYFVREAPSDGYAVTDITCSEAGGEWNNWQKGINKATVALADGEDVTCTFTNTEMTVPVLSGDLTLSKATEPANSPGRFDFTLVGQVGEFDGTESPAGQFRGPRGVATDADGNFYVADYNNRRVLKFDSTGTYLLGEMESPVGLGQVFDVTVDSAGYVYVTISSDRSGHIQKFTGEGMYLTSMGNFFWPRNVVVDSSGNIFVNEHDFKNQIQKYDASTNTWIIWSGSGGGPVEFDGVGGIALDNQDILYIADSGNKRILKVNSDGTPLGEIGLNFSPGNLTVDAGGNLYVVEAGANRIQKLYQDGTLAAYWGSSGSGPGQFSSPSGLATNSEGHLFVADYYNNRIQKFVDDATTLQHGQSAVYNDVEPGTYFIREVPVNPERWTVAATCAGEVPPPETSEVFVTLAENDQAACTFTNILDNDAPTVEADHPRVTVDEGTQATNNGTYVDPRHDDPVTLGALAGVVIDNGSGSWNWTFDSSDGPDDSQTVTVTAVDSYRAEGQASFDLVVNNVAPSFDAGGDETLAPLQVGAFSRSAISFSDPGADFWSGTVNWGDSDDDKSLVIDQGNKRLDLAHTYTAEGTYTVLVTVKDDDGGEQSDSFTVTVQLNTPPTADAGGPYSVDEGSSILLDGSGSMDNEQDPAALTFEWDLDGDGEYDDATGISPEFSAANADGPGTAAVGLKVTDDYGESDTDTAVININNVAPTILTLTVPWEEPVNISDQASFSIDVAFEDPAGALDVPYCQFDFDGDGTLDTDIIPATYGDYGMCSTQLTYAEPGVYTVKVIVSDKDDGADSATATDFIVVYDPEGGFVTGGGWIDSPAGAYNPDPSLNGKATFGFVSKYKKGADTPSGNTEFQFKAGDLNFHSSVYDWLVVAGPQAKFKGTGTINGSGEYGFMLSAVDGQVNGGGGIDKFRIKIWDKATGTVIYDNQLGAGDDAEPTTALGGGSIVIHKAK